MSAIGSTAGPRGKTFAISAYADFRHDHLRFERQQSLALRQMEWEGRLEPILPWSTLLLRCIGAVIAACVILAALT